MPYERKVLLDHLPFGNDLIAGLAGIGMNFAVAPSPDPNIEDLLIAASVEGMEQDDLRILSVLTTWVGIHHPIINADRLVRMVRAHPSPRVRGFWAAIALWLKKNRRFLRLREICSGPPLDLLRTGQEFQILRKGEDPRLEGGPLRVPAGVLRDRTADVLSPRELAKMSRTYRNLIQMGPTYRTDI